MRFDKINWLQICLSAFYLAMAVSVVLEPYGEKTIFIAIMNSLVMAFTMLILGLSGWQIRADKDKEEQNERME